MLKIRSTSKEASNKSCSELNFVQKSSRVDLSIPTRVKRGAPKINISEIL